MRHKTLETNLHRRYVKRLTRLVERRYSAALARCAGVEDIVQFVFASFFRRIDQGFYDVPVGETAWKLLLIFALNAIPTQATYYNAAKRDTHRTIRGVLALQRLTLQINTIDGYTIAEVARLAGRSMRTVERVIHESRLKLSGLLEVED
jgi:RNA polymerase sigma-70 factor, ECF subfamily